MNVESLLERALNFEFLTKEEGIFLYHHAATTDLAYVANELRKIQVPHGKVTWQIDRNVNTTNVCIANCKFCNFFRRPGHEDSYITDIETYKQKIEETFKYGGDQLLLQGLPAKLYRPVIILVFPSVGYIVLSIQRQIQETITIFIDSIL